MASGIVQGNAVDTGPGLAAARARAVSAAGSTDEGREWPVTREEMVAEYTRRERAYLGLAYRVEDIKRLNLFRAVDSANQTIAMTRRLTRDLQFVCEVDAAAIVGDGLLVESRRDRYDLDADDDRRRASAEAERAAATLRAEAVWERSRVEDQLPAWALRWCMLGDIGFEVVRGAVAGVGAVIVAHDPRHVVCDWDDIGAELRRVVITYDYTEQAEYDPATGEVVKEPAIVRYRRILTRERVDAYRDGVRVEEESGAHGLGRVPFEWVPFRAPVPGSMGTWAGYGYEDVIGSVDSALTQMQVTGQRHANPLLVALGARIGEASEIQQVGRAASLPQGADLKYLEATLQGIQALLNMAESARQMVAQTLPEFLFVDAGASASGTALSYRAGAFVAKIDPIRHRFYRALGRCVDMAVAFDTSTPHRSLAGTYEVQGGAALPMDVTSLARLYTDLTATGGMRSVDLVRKLQDLGVVPDDVEPEVYAAQAAREVAERQAQTAMQVERIMDAVRAAAPVTDDDPGEPSDLTRVLGQLADTATDDATREAVVRVAEAAGIVPREGAA